MNDREIAALEAEIVTLFAEIFALTAHALRKIAAFDAAKAWASLGYQSAAHWLNVRMGISLGTGREHVRVAHALGALPQIAGAFERGELSYSKVRAITRIATPATEESLLVMSLTGTAAQMERIVRMTRKYGALEARKQAEHRSIVMGTDDDGMFCMRVRLLPDEGARVVAAMNAHMPKDARDAEYRRADALLDALSSADGTEVVIHVDVDETGAQQVETAIGERIAVSAESSRRAACDASVRMIAHRADGSVLDVGRKTRRISAPLRRAVAERDRGCRFPGCPNTRVDAHHVEHWAAGGATSLGNLISLCRFHHVQLHEGGCEIIDGEFYRADGKRITAETRMLDLPVRPTIERERLHAWSGIDTFYRHADIPRAAQGLVERLLDERATKNVALSPRRAD